MKFVRYEQADQAICYGSIEGTVIRRIQGSIFGDYQLDSQTISLDQVKLLAPVIPNKLIAIGLNYKKHAEEMNKPLPTVPMIFLVSPTAIIGHGDTIQIKHPDNRTEHESELAIVIGKQADGVSASEALDYVLGYTCCNDISDRVLQNIDGQFTRAKSFATYKPLGPVIDTDIDPNHAAIQLSVNGEIRQDSNTSDMIFSVAEIVSFVSHVMRLEPGDVIITGTPSGVTPLKGGDTVEVHIAGIGKLVNTVTV